MIGRKAILLITLFVSLSFLPNLASARTIDFEHGYNFFGAGTTVTEQQLQEAGCDLLGFGRGKDGRPWQSYNVSKLIFAIDPGRMSDKFDKIRYMTDVADKPWQAYLIFVQNESGCSIIVENEQPITELTLKNGYNAFALPADWDGLTQSYMESQGCDLLSFGDGGFKWEAYSLANKIFTIDWGMHPDGISEKFRRMVNVVEPYKAFLVYNDGPECTFDMCEGEECGQGTSQCTAECQDEGYNEGECRLKSPGTTIPPNEALLYAEGTSIMRNGERYNLYGMDQDHHPRMKTIGGSDAGSPYSTTFTTEDMDFYKENGFNLVTIHLIWLSEMTDGSGNIKESFFENWVDVWVDWCTERQIYCIIGMADLHVSNIEWGVYTMPSWVADDYGGMPSGSDWRAQMRTIIHGFYGMDSRSDDERQVYYNLWKYIANRYKDNPYVMYGPTNEPLHHTWQNYAPGDSYWHQLGTKYSETMTEVVDHIREGEQGGLEKLVFIDRPYLENGEYVEFAKPIDRGNIVWEYHNYGGLSSWNSLSSWKSQIEDERDFFYAWGKPVHVGEWSVANTIEPEFWQIDSSYSSQGGWRYFHEEQSKWMSQMDVSHSWFHYARLDGEYWNIHDGGRALTQSDSDFIIDTLVEESRNTVSTNEDPMPTGPACQEDETEISAGCTAGYACCCSGVYTPPTTSSTTPSTVPIQNAQPYTSGTSILVDGNPIILKGMQVMNEKEKKDDSGSDASHADQCWFNEDDVARLKAEGVNMLDLSHIPFWSTTDSNGNIRTDYFEDFMDQWADWCRETRMYCIINYPDFNVDGGDGSNYMMPEWVYEDYRSSRPVGQSQTAPILLDFWDDSVSVMDDERETWFKLWGFTANRYKDNPYIMYSLVNEPVHHVWKYGSSSQLTRIRSSYARICEEAIDRMRATGSDQIVFVEIPYTIEGSHDRTYDIKPVSRANVIREYHEYIRYPSEVQEWKDAVGSVYSTIQNQGQPLYVGEWGWWEPEKHRDAATWKSDLTQLKDFMETRGIHQGWHAFAWFRDGESPSLGTDSYWSWLGYNSYHNKGVERAYRLSETQWILDLITS